MASQAWRLLTRCLFSLTWLSPTKDHPIRAAQNLELRKVVQADPSADPDHSPLLCITSAEFHDAMLLTVSVPNKVSDCLIVSKLPSKHSAAHGVF